MQNIETITPETGWTNKSDFKFNNITVILLQSFSYFTPFIFLSSFTFFQSAHPQTSYF
jgi:hypothetical protein